MKVGLFSRRQRVEIARRFHKVPRDATQNYGLEIRGDVVICGIDRAV
jgi:hypothetical protein